MIQADALCLPFPAKTFDLVFTAPPWDRLDVFAAALPELRRVVKPKGRMVFVLPHLGERKRLASLVFTNRDQTERQSFAIPYPDRRVGPRYFSLDPNLVRGVLGKHRKGRVLDPFCGVGTIPTEASRLGWRAVGCDIDRQALEMAS